MAALVSYNLALDAGCDYTSPTWTWETGDPPAAVSLVGSTAKLQIRSVAGAADPAQLTLTEASSASGQVILGGALGTIYFTVTDTATTALTITNGQWDLIITLSTGIKWKFAGGAVQVSDTVTV